jgi:signal transduction histidine kinase
MSITAEAFVRYLSWGIFALIFLVTSLHALRRPSRATVDPALLFGASALVIIISVSQDLGLLPRSPLLSALSATALLSLPYLLFRLIDNVVGVSPALHRAIAAGLALSVLAVWAIPQSRPGWLDGLLLLAVVALLVYVVALGAWASRRFRGVTQRRLAAVTVGSLFLGLNFVAGNLPRWTPISEPDARSLADLAGLAVGVCYYVGFAPPRWLRRTWQEPELRAFLERAAQLPRLPTTAAILQALEHGAASSLGAPYARIGMWHEDLQALRFSTPGAPFDVPLASELPAATVFRSQRPLFSAKTRYDPATDQIFHFSQIASAVLAAPITAGERRLGVLTVSAARAPLFAEDDLALVQLLADQAAVILESRYLIDEAAHVRAREEVARLKEDFLSAAAHDLRTPLTTIVAQAQMIDRRLDQNPERPIDRASIQRIVAESERLRSMVRDLLDASRADQGRLLGLRAPMDVTRAAQDVARRHSSPRHPCTVSAPGPIVGLYDAARIGQLLENLVENAVKYSPDGGSIELALAQDSSGVHISVADHGIGIPPADLPKLFDRFHRGANVDDRRFPGMGLGLYICHAIVTQHGGTIVAESSLGGGTRFHITLPATLVSEVAQGGLQAAQPLSERIADDPATLR